jgi:toxin YoeB
LEFKPQAFEDLQHWVSTKPRLANKILHFIEDTTSNPFSGTGKPEPLKGDLAGWWSRRIDQEHRLVYKVESGTLVTF